MKTDNFYALLQERFRPALDRRFLTFPDGNGVTYKDMDALSAKMSGTLTALGAKAGDRILVQVEKSVENVALYLATLRTGLIYTPLNTAYTGEEIDYFLRDAQPRIFVCDPQKEAALKPVAIDAGVAEIKTLDGQGNGSLIELLEKASPLQEISPRHADDLAVILYTSGTTGRSKGAMLSHGALASNALALNNLWGISSEDVLLHALPVFHIHGLFVALHTLMLSGAEILFLPKFDADEVLRALPRATVMMGVPTFYTRLLQQKNFDKKSCTHMRLFISGSAPLTIAASEAFKAQSGHDILERYGMSEAGMITSNPLDGARIAGTVGYALPGVELRITGEKGDALPNGEAGNVEIKGPNLFKGYWRNPEQTEEAFTKDGFFITGDVGSLDAEGRLTLAGRSKDLIIAGGYNIYPKEIEQVLDDIPGVAESAVIGVPHPDMGEGVMAVLIAESESIATDTLKAAIASLARFKHPRKFVWLDALPRNAMGKVQKQLLREQFRETFTAKP